jgi:putative ABC transport system permease protein
MKPGVTSSQTKADLDSVAARLRQEYPRDMAQLTGINVLSLTGELVGSSRMMLWLLMGAVGLLLLITCANLASLMIAKASLRENELAIRSALGATPARLASQSLVESLLLSMAGGAGGLLVSGWGIAALLALSPADLPRSREIHIDTGVFLWTLAISPLAGLLFGVFPALQTRRRDLNDGLRTNSRSSAGGLRTAKVRSALVVAEVGISLTLLVGTGLLLKSFSRVADVNPGFRTRNVLTVSLALPAARYTTTDSIATFHDRLKQKLEQLPGVVSVGSISMLPLTGLRASTPFTVSGHPPASPVDTPNAQYRVIGPGYFRSMGIPVLRGRDFSESDTAATTPVVIISDGVARKYLGGLEPVGAHLMINDSNAPRDVEIVGVAADIHGFGLEEPLTPTNYVPFTQMRQSFAPFVTNNSFWVLNSPLDPRALAGVVRRELRDVDGDVAIAGAVPIEDYMQQSMHGRRFTLQIMSLFALAAIVLAAAGLYSVISYSTAQRTREIGVRMALGAKSSDVVRLVVGKGVALALIGVAAGAVGAAGLSRLIRGMLFQVIPSDPLIFAAGGLILVAAAALASYLPARRATRIDPLTALHGD